MEQNVLLTPGPLTTSSTVKAAMQYDVGTRDTQYQCIVESIRMNLLQLAHASESRYACILLQGSGTYGVESVVTTVINKKQKVLILSNGAYGDRMGEICKKAGVAYKKVDFSMCEALPITQLEEYIKDPSITHVAYIHSETTAGVLNDIVAIQHLIHTYNKISIVDAMSSFGGIELSLDKLQVDYLITSSNKCLHGVPGIAIIFANRHHLNTCKDNCQSLSLDLYEQYQYMEQSAGAFRFTSPTHVVLALQCAIEELQQSGGISIRQQRYTQLQKEICEAMKQQGFSTLVKPTMQSPIITTYRYKENFHFKHFYDYFKQHGFLLYSGKLPGIDAFRIGNIGAIKDVDIATFKQLLFAYKEDVYEGANTNQ